ncbi:MAG: excisionase family DNA-binding protein [Desulfobulbaceae bacterium]|nr:excisionase family DNA-binding protein [Desulfobulbaceae bacterium]
MDVLILLRPHLPAIYNWINNKNMPAHKIGRLWKFKKDEVDNWVRKDGAAIK